MASSYERNRAAWSWMLAVRISSSGWWRATKSSIALRTVAGAPIAEQDSARSIIARSEEHTSELQSLMRISYAVFCLKKKKNKLEIQYKKQTLRRLHCTHHNTQITNCNESK